tara:strand:+ start:1438 stop:2391 length:954 start_codon:yes stop_codon:yes gene_type:complete
MRYLNTPPPSWTSGVNVTFYDSIQYGNANINNMDIFLPSDEVTPTGCIINLHGGGFIYGDKGDIYDDATKQAVVKEYLNQGIAYISINYTLIQQFNETVGIMPCMDSSVLALQFVKFYADSFNIDKNNIALNGGSSGGGIALWIASQPSLADPTNVNFIKREDTNVVAITLYIAQASYDFPGWDTQVFSSLGYDFDADYKTNQSTVDGTNRTYGVNNLAEISQEPTVSLRAELNMLDLIATNGAICPVYLKYTNVNYNEIVNNTIIDGVHNDYQGEAIRLAIANYVAGGEVEYLLESLYPLHIPSSTLEAWLINKLT